MRDKRAEARWLLIGIVMSGAAGILIGFLTGNRLLVIAAGVFSAFLVQRLRRSSEEGDIDSKGDEENPSNTR